MNKILALLLILHIWQIISASKNCNFSLDVKLEVSGNKSCVDLRKFIEDGLKKSSAPSVKDKGLMVMGLTGTGKSTLINYLNDVPLICK